MIKWFACKFSQIFGNSSFKGGILVGVQLARVHISKEGGAAGGGGGGGANL